MIIETERESDAPAGLFGRLRHATAEDHRALEEIIDVSGASISKERMLRTLEKFLGFHRVWEPALRGHARFDGIFAQRSRVLHLESDLAALGLPPARIASVPRCAPAAVLARSAPAAMGSLYVMEGSTLGGQVISRGLRDIAWLPREGLRYFGSPGTSPRARWAALAQWAAGEWPSPSWPAIVGGARDTFQLLGNWFKEAA